MKTTKRRAWTPVQVRDLKAMARKKKPASQIAKKLGRSEGATRQKAFSIRVSLKSGWRRLAHTGSARTRSTRTQSSTPAIRRKAA